MQTQGVSNYNSNIAAQKSQRQELGKDEFLKLLVTQLRYQDPLAPLEDKEFIAQMAQFSSLEQLQQLNGNIAGFMYSLNFVSALGQAASLIGKEVTVFDPRTDKEIIGEVEATRLFDGVPKLVIAGELYDLGWLREIKA